ncbi:hypothetical protein [Butyrivibrio fibrisolvens]|uniref:hypothetical protein n=1 Tax=Butyrivibrio fibrisolvens TaxID=831 RepID=UPI00041EAD6A|nr:hypothetical protein [Butyrivibrio fibrisolvens]
MNLNNWKSKDCFVKTIVILSAVIITICSYLNCFSMISFAQGSDSLLEDMTKTELSDELNIDDAAEQYHVDSQVLLDKVYNDIHSDTGYFSPFSDIKLGIDGDRFILNAMLRSTPPYFIARQQSTMYLATGNKTANNKWPYVGSCAVHRKSKDDRTPIFPFGSCIHYDVAVNISGTNYRDFIVEDTGDKNYTRTTYWTDVYGGKNTSENQKMAFAYGVKYVNITWD